MAEGIYIALCSLCPIPIVQMSDSESNSGPPGFANITGGTVYYLYTSPNPPELKDELTFMSDFLVKWNADEIVSPLFLCISGSIFRAILGYPLGVTIKHTCTATNHPPSCNVSRFSLGPY